MTDDPSLPTDDVPQAPMDVAPELVSAVSGRIAHEPRPEREATDDE